MISTTPELSKRELTKCFETCRAIQESPRPRLLSPPGPHLLPVAGPGLGQRPRHTGAESCLHPAACPLTSVISTVPEPVTVLLFGTVTKGVSRGAARVLGAATGARAVEAGVGGLRHGASRVLERPCDSWPHSRLVTWRLLLPHRQARSERKWKKIELPCSAALTERNLTAEADSRRVTSFLSARLLVPHVIILWDRASHPAVFSSTQLHRHGHCRSHARP